MDSHDFIPTTVSEGCDPLGANAVGKTYWQGEFDQSCEQANGADSNECNVFTTYYQQISTPFMVIVPLEEVGPGGERRCMLMHSSWSRMCPAVGCSCPTALTMCLWQTRPPGRRWRCPPSTPPTRPPSPSTRCFPTG